MLDYSCPRCGGCDLYYEPVGYQYILLCDECGCKVKTVSSKELKSIQYFLEKRRVKGV